MASNSLNASSIGGTMAVFGLFSTLLSFFDYNLRILMWIDSWGPTVGWIIRIALIIGGLALYFIFKTEEVEEAEPKQYTE